MAKFKSHFQLLWQVCRISQGVGVPEKNWKSRQQCFTSQKRTTWSCPTAAQTCRRRGKPATNASASTARLCTGSVSRPGHRNVLRSEPLSIFQMRSSPVLAAVTRFGESSISAHARMSLSCAGACGGTCREEATTLARESSKNVS